MGGGYDPMEFKGKLSLSALPHEPIDSTLDSAQLHDSNKPAKDSDLQESMPNTPRDAASQPEIPTDVTQGDSINMSVEMDMSMDDW